MDKNTKSREISEKLRQEILSGKFDTTRKLPSEHQLMRRFSVARETVRAALKGTWRGQTPIFSAFAITICDNKTD
mgnify:CR=1 FL=1